MRSFWSLGDSVLETKRHIPAYNSLAPKQIHHRPHEDSWKHEKIRGFIPTLFQNNMLRCKATPSSFDAFKECIFYLPTFPGLYLSPFWCVGVPALRSYLRKFCCLPSRGTRQRSGGGAEKDKVSAMGEGEKKGGWHDSLYDSIIVPSYSSPFEDLPFQAWCWQIWS